MKLIVFYNKIALNLFPDELKDSKKIQRALIFKRILVKNLVSKIYEGICNIPTEAANIFNILPKSAVPNGFILIKLKSSVKCRSHVYF